MVIVLAVQLYGWVPVTPLGWQIYVKARRGGETVTMLNEILPTILGRTFFN